MKAKPTKPVDVAKINKNLNEAMEDGSEIEESIGDSFQETKTTFSLITLTIKT